MINAFIIVYIVFGQMVGEGNERGQRLKGILGWNQGWRQEMTNRLRSRDGSRRRRQSRRKWWLLLLMATVIHQRIGVEF